MSTITLDSVAKRFGRETAVDNISLRVAEGEFLSLLGPSGCGKTTTLRMIAGFIMPSDGQIYFDQQSVTNIPPYRRDIGMVFQTLALFPHMTVAENVAYGLRPRHKHGTAREETIKDMLELVHLSGFESRMPDELSGGQRQRVAIARALAINPRILLLDEPFAALDRKLREEMQVEVKRLHEQLQITTVFVTHDQREAFTLSDRIAVMSSGRIEQLGTPQEIYYQPASRFVADFVGTANLFEAKVSSRENASATVELLNENARLTVPIDGNAPPGELGFLFVRPEFVAIKTEDSGDSSLLKATVDLVRFVGELIETRLTTRGGTHVVATSQGAERTQVSAGQDVFIQIAARHAYLLQ